MKFYTKTITAQNTFTNTIDLDPGEGCAISLTGITASTVSLQRRFNPTGDWRDVATYTANTEINYQALPGIEIRLGVKTGDYGGGDTVLIEIKTSGRLV